MREYRKNPLEFHSNFDKEDVIRAEDEIMNFIDIDCTREQARGLLSRICEVMFDLNPYEDDEVAYTAKGTRVLINYVDDCDDNVGGYFCEIYLDGEDYWDDFVIHTDDVDCNDWDAVVAYAKDYVSKITNY